MPKNAPVVSLCQTMGDGGKIWIVEYRRYNKRCVEAFTLKRDAEKRMFDAFAEGIEIAQHIESEKIASRIKKAERIKNQQIAHRMEVARRIEEERKAVRKIVHVTMWDALEEQQGYTSTS